MMGSSATELRKLLVLVEGVSGIGCVNVNGSSKMMSLKQDKLHLYTLSIVRFSSLINGFFGGGWVFIGRITIIVLVDFLFRS